MGLRDRAKSDIENITSNSSTGFGIEMTFTSPDNKTATITGIHSKHHLGIDTDGNAVNSEKAHVSFSEKFLIDALYPVRNAAGEVDLVNHRVSVKDSTGIVKEYVMQSIFPNETVGLITCIIQAYTL